MWFLFWRTWIGLRIRLGKRWDTLEITAMYTEDLVSLLSKL